MSRPARLLAVIAATAAIALATAPAAGAHVTVNPGEAAKGSFAKLAFRVPNERDSAGTTTVEINFPADHPIAFVSVRPHPGWTYTVERTRLAAPLEVEGRQITEAVSKITFTGGPIRPGEFDEFEVSVGPLPEDADELVFPTLQTYQGGEIVRWIEATPPGGKEPDHPAPVLRLVEGSGDEHAHSEKGSNASDTEKGKNTGNGLAVRNVAYKDDVRSVQTLAIVALVVGGVGLLAGIGGFLRRRAS